MKKIIKIILIVVCIAIAGGWAWWQYHKKGIIRDSIEHAVSKGSDSLYFIRYDSSSIDEINGNANFYNVVLQSDSLQKQLLQFDTASADVIYNIQIDKVAIRGANIPALMNNSKVEARSIEITHPVVYIISSGKKKKEKVNSFDNVALYEKILGRYNAINAAEIIIENGHLNFTDKNGEPQTALKDIYVQLKNFRIDSTKDYNNIVSYFIKDVIAKVKEISLKTENHFITFTDVEYNAPGKFMSLGRFLEKDTLDKIVFDINNTTIIGISTDAFILQQQIKADSFKTGGGLVTLFRKSKAGAAKETKETIELDNSSFDEALVNNIDIRNTTVVIYNKSEPKESPFILKNVQFIAGDIQKLSSGTNIKQLVSNSRWKLSADGFSFLSKDKIYKYNVGAFDIDNRNSSMRIKNFYISPQVTEQAFVKSLKYQNDLYNIEFKNIELTGLDTKMLVTETKVMVEAVTLEPLLRVFNDRTVTPNPASKVGMYPQQLLQKLKVPLFARKIYIKNGSVFYKERGALSKQTGVVFFKNVNGTINNVTNIKELMNKDNLLVLEATGIFMDVSKLHTTWKLVLNASNGSFKVSGKATGFNAESLNTVAEPLGMASIKKGKVNMLEFDMNGDDYKATGTTTLNYEDLKMELLKKDSNELKKKDFMSFIANALIKNGNSKNETIKPVDMSFDRDTTKSFFNLVWKTIFEGTKNTIQKL